MARKPSAIGTFLKTSKGFTETTKPEEMKAPKIEVAKEQVAGQQKQVEGVQKQAEAIGAKTTPQQVEGAGGVKYDTSAYTVTPPTLATGTTAPVTQAAPKTAEELLTYTPTTTDYTKLGEQAKTTGAVAAEQNVQKMGSVRDIFLTKGLEEAKKDYKAKFGVDMPANVESSFGTGLDPIRAYLNQAQPGATFGKESTAEVGAQTSMEDILGGSPTSQIGALTGMFNEDPRLAKLAAAESQAFNDPLQQLKTQAALTQAGKEATASGRAQSIDEFLRQQTAGKKNVEDYRKKVAETTAGEATGLKDINAKQVDDLVKSSTAAEKEGNTAEINKSFAGLLGSPDKSGDSSKPKALGSLDKEADTISKEVASGNFNNFETFMGNIEKTRGALLSQLNKGNISQAVYDMYKKYADKISENMTSAMKTKNDADANAEADRLKKIKDTPPPVVTPPPGTPASPTDIANNAVVDENGNLVTVAPEGTQAPSGRTGPPVSTQPLISKETVKKIETPITNTIKKVTTPIANYLGIGPSQKATAADTDMDNKLATMGTHITTQYNTVMNNPNASFLDKIKADIRNDSVKNGRAAPNVTLDTAISDKDIQKRGEEVTNNFTKFLTANTSNPNIARKLAMDPTAKSKFYTFFKSGKTDPASVKAFKKSIGI